MGLTLPVILPRSSKMSTSLLVSCDGVATRPGLYPMAKETVEAAPIHRVWSQWMETTHFELWAFHRRSHLLYFFLVFDVLYYSQWLLLFLFLNICIFLFYLLFFFLHSTAILEPCLSYICRFNVLYPKTTQYSWNMFLCFT